MGFFQLLQLTMFNMGVFIYGRLAHRTSLLVRFIGSTLYYFRLYSHHEYFHLYFIGDDFRFFSEDVTVELCGDVNVYRLLRVYSLSLLDMYATLLYLSAILRIRRGTCTKLFMFHELQYILNVLQDDEQLLYHFYLSLSIHVLSLSTFYVVNGRNGRVFSIVDYARRSYKGELFAV